MADAKLARGLQLDHVAAIDVHHAAQLGYDYVEKAIEIDGVRQSHRETINNPLAGLVHFNLAFQRKGLSAVRHRMAQRIDERCGKLQKQDSSTDYTDSV